MRCNHPPASPMTYIAIVEDVGLTNVETFFLCEFCKRPHLCFHRSWLLRILGRFFFLCRRYRTKSNHFDRVMKKEKTGIGGMTVAFGGKLA